MYLGVLVDNADAGKAIAGETTMRMIGLFIGLLLVGLSAAHAETVTSQRQLVPLMLSAAHPSRHGFVRIANRSDRAGTARIYAIDDAGERFGPVDLALEADAVAHFNSADLEYGNAAKGLAEGLGSGQGDWRLELQSDLDILPQAFARASGGILTNLSDVETALDDGRCYVHFFNPASNSNQVSLLRLTNSGDEEAEITISGIDDRGAAPPEGDVRLTLPANQSRTVSAQQLEHGGPELRGLFGDGAGKWRLFVSANRPIGVMNLLDNTGNSLAKLSDCTATKRLGNVVISGDDAANWGEDSYELSAAGIVGDTLTATVSYGGGCAEHEFTLVVSDAFMLTDPVRVQTTLAHNANGDPCEAWLTEQLQFDLTPIREADGQPRGTIVLLLDNAPDGELVYTF